MNPLRWGMGRLLLLALVLRLLPILATRAHEVVPNWPIALDHDGLGYASYADHLVRGDGYVEDTGDRSHRGPGYPLLIAATFLVGGTQFLLLRIVQALLGTLSCWLLYRIARGGWGEEAGRWVLLVSAAYLPFLFYCPQVLNSTLYLFLVVATLAATLWASEGGCGRALVPGLLLGASALTAGTILGAAPALALWLAWRRRSLLAPALMALACVAALAPWAVRNWQVHGAPILLDTNSGGVLYLGNVNYGMWVDPDAPDALDEVKRTTDYARLDEAGKDKLLRGLAVSWMKAHPAQFLKVWSLKFLHGWSPVPGGNKPWPAVAASLATYGLALVLGLWGAWKAWQERNPAGLLLIGYLLAVSVTHALFVFAQRHRVPLLDPALLVLAASSIRKPSA